MEAQERERKEEEREEEVDRSHQTHRRVESGEQSKLKMIGNKILNKGACITYVLLILNQYHITWRLYFFYLN